MADAFIQCDCDRCNEAAEKLRMHKNAKQFQALMAEMADDVGVDMRVTFSLDHQEKPPQSWEGEA